MFDYKTMKRSRPRPRPEDYRTYAEYRWARKLWLREHGGSFVGTLALALFFGGLSGSTTALWLLVGLAVVGTIVARSLP
jgi:hypothetical protein